MDLKDSSFAALGGFAAHLFLSRSLILAKPNPHCFRKWVQDVQSRGRVVDYRNGFPTASAFRLHKWLI